MEHINKEKIIQQIVKGIKEDVEIYKKTFIFKCDIEDIYNELLEELIDAGLSVEITVTGDFIIF